MCLTRKRFQQEGCQTVFPLWKGGGRGQNCQPRAVASEQGSPITNRDKEEGHFSEGHEFMRLSTTECCGDRIIADIHSGDQQTF